MRISLTLQRTLDIPHVLHDPFLDLVGARGLVGAKEEGDAQDWDVYSGCDVEEEAEQCHL
jgi:hypothetical protein